MQKNISAIVNKIVLVIGLIIGSLFLSSFVISSLDGVIGDGKLSPWENAQMSKLSMIFILSGLLAIFTNLKVNRALGFIGLSALSIAIIISQWILYPTLVSGENIGPGIIQIYSIIGSLALPLPLIVWAAILRSR